VRRIDLPDAQLWFDPHWLDPATADALFDALHEQIVWETHRLRIFGREREAPRRSRWIGDPGARYVYSRTAFEPHPWPAALLPLRRRLEHEAESRFNSVLANLYRDGRDSMGWHSDDEPELGSEPVIASLSLGAARRFVLKQRGALQRRLALDLPHGSLLLMRGPTQRFWKHALPRTARAVGARINLTFRQIDPTPIKAASAPRRPASD
jgi:alkylated DNA repair dioxygenase AlkB